MQAKYQFSIAKPAITCYTARMETDKEYICYIVNPKSGSSSAGSLIWDFQDYLKLNNIAVKTIITKSLEHAVEVTAKARNDSHCKMIIAAGGDGTICQILSAMQGSSKPVMPIPSGTENLLASQLGYDERLSTFVKAFNTKKTTTFDICKANDQCFTSIAGFGFDASVVKNLSTLRNGNIDYTDYVWPFWRGFWNYKFPPMKIVADGETLYDGRCLVFVGNISRYAMGLNILKNAKFNDGLVDVCVLKASHHLKLAYGSFLTVLKLHTKSNMMVYKQARNIKITSDSEIDVQLDGDPGPNLPVEITVNPQAVTLVIPENSKPTGMRTRLVRFFQ